MTDYMPYLKDLIIFAVIPLVVFIFKLHEKQVRQEERHNALADKVEHNWKNIKMALEQLAHEIEGVKADVKELLKLYNGTKG